MMYYIYYNLHKRVFSLKNWKTKLVDGHEDSVYLKDATFKVSEKGRQRVLKEKKKNVHAGVLGTLESLPLLSDIASQEAWIELFYNPYKGKGFTNIKNGCVAKTAQEVYMSYKRVYARGISYEN